MDLRELLHHVARHIPGLSEANRAEARDAIDQAFPAAPDPEPETAPAVPPPAAPAPAAPAPSFPLPAAGAPPGE